MAHRLGRFAEDHATHSDAAERIACLAVAPPYATVLALMESNSAFRVIRRWLMKVHHHLRLQLFGCAHFLFSA
jgi:hypothetical protein